MSRWFLVLPVGLAISAGSVLGQVVKLTDPGAFSGSTVVLDFEEPLFNVGIANVYHGAGVRFSAEGFGVPESTFVELSPGFPMPVIDRVVRNIAKQGSSANSDLLLHFDYPVRRVGLTLGNGNPTTVATITAISPSGTKLGSIEQGNIDSLQGPFVGVETADPEGISTLVLSFGEEETAEQMNDLRFDFLTPRPFVTYVPQIAFGTVGELRLDMNLQIHKPLLPSGEVLVEFKDTSGAPMAVIVDGISLSSISLQMRLPIPRTLQIDGGNALKVGYARLESTQPIEAQATYIVHRGGAVFSEASVTATPERVIQVIGLERNVAIGLDAGIAVTNIAETPTLVSLTVLDQELTSALQTNLDLEPGEQRSFFVSEAIEMLSDHFRGGATVRSTGPVVVTVLRTRHGLPFSSLRSTGTQW